jgi:uncharacterized protein (DUF4415 family)
MPRKPPKGYDENPEWTKTDFAKAKKPKDALSSAALKNFRGPQKTPTKVPVSIRLNPVVVEYFKSLGPGWQSRIDEALTEMIAADKPKLRIARTLQTVKLKGANKTPPRSRKAS